MHMMSFGPGSSVMISTQLVLTDDPWTAPRIRLQLRTDLDSGVILDFADPHGLQCLASTTRALLASYRDAQRRVRAQRVPRRPMPRALDL